MLYDSHDITGAPPYRIARLGVGRSFQIINTFPRLTVYQSVRSAIKNAKCYRHYVAHRPPPGPGARPVRIPAQDLETLVVQRLLRWLSDQLALLDALSAAGDEAALFQGLLASASARCQAWPKLAPEQLRQFVRAVIVRVTIGVDRIVIALNKSALRTRLLPAAAQGASPRLSRLRTISSSSPSKRTCNAAAARCAWWSRRAK